MLEDSIRRAREREVPWNELRQAGALRRIEKARAASPRSVRYAPLVALGAACAVVTCVVLWRVHGHRRATPALATASAPAADVAPAGSQPSGETVLRLADGSTARQAEGASVQVQAVDDERAELLQTHGSVRYEVVPNARRRFVVRARDVNVNVLGTIFRVEVQPLAVTVHVDRGQVEVAQQDRRVRLDPGEEITFGTSDAPSEGPAPNAAASAGSPPPTPGAPPPAGRAGSSPQSGERGAGTTSALALLEEADRARAAGDLEGAARSLRQLLRTYPADRRVALAEFMLGRVETARGSNAEAARAFGACLAHGAAGALGEDALAEGARAQARSGDTSAATSLARRYLATYPSGVHRRAMQRLADGEN